MEIGRIPANNNPDFSIPEKAKDTHLFYHITYYSQTQKGAAPDKKEVTLTYSKAQYLLMDEGKIFSDYLRTKYGQGAEIEIIHKPENLD